MSRRDKDKEMGEEMRLGVVAPQFSLLLVFVFSQHRAKAPLASVDSTSPAL
jgi:hypothetical protein